MIRLFVAILALASGSSLHAAFPTLTLKPVCLDQLKAPTAIVNAGDGTGRLIIAEQRGKIRVFKNGMLLPTPFMDLGAKLVTERASYDERGLIGLAFHPDYENAMSPGHRRFYVFYNAPSPNAPGNAANPVDSRTTIAEYLVSATDPNIADPLSERILISFDKPQFNHNGGQLEFGPDGMLYIATGDGGSANDNNAGHTGGSSSRPTNALGNSQDRTNLMGGILRIDPLGNNGPGGQYGIPVDNPFVGAGGSIREEIFAYGLRNPWRFSFDIGPGGTRIFCPDVGQGRIEEVNIITSGSNCGWRYLEGNENPTFSSGAVSNPMPNPGGPFVAPIAMYAHPNIVTGSPALPQLGVSITGGYLYRGLAIPALQGKYIFADYSFSGSSASGIMLGIEETSPGVWSTVNVLTLTNGNPLQTRIYTMGRDETGELYVGTNTANTASGNDPVTGRPGGGLYKMISAATGSSAINPSKDNTMFSENTANSNGQGRLFAGRIASGGLRRALLAFDVAPAIPSGATVSGVSLSLKMDTTSAPAFDFTLHRLNQDWGEGASNAGASGAGAAAQPGDATWSHRIYNTDLWTTAGGDFIGTASATTSVNGLGSYTWSGAGLIADVETWLANPAQNFGWLLKGDENSTSAKRFHSGEDATIANQPTLTINHVSTPPLSRRETWLQQYFFVGQNVDDLADLDGDSEVNLFEYAYGHSPLVSNSTSPGLTATGPTQANPNFTIHFRRDPRAVDLTYRLQTSDSLSGWTTIVESVGGAVPSGTGFQSEADAPSEAPIQIVTASEAVPIPTRRFTRLIVVRQQ
jgi:glucose/arabinose dehydrogenase